MFKEPTENKAMTGHVIRSEEVPNQGTCRLMCYMEPDCVSINFGPSEGGKYKCELNSATEENDLTFVLQDRASYTYLAAENPCSSSPCLSGAICQVGFTSKGFRCICPAGIPGPNCCAAKSCSHLKRLDPTAESGNYVIDPDGEGGLPPLQNVTCDMSDKNGVGVTVISHDSENRTLVQGCENAGCYSRGIDYSGASLSQLASLTEVSTHCEQFIKYECKGSLMFKDNQHAWWESRDSVMMTYWGGAEPGSGKCACGMNNSCADTHLACNCDKNDNVWREDSGLLTDKTHLPVKKLRFGDTGKAENGFDELGYHTLGKFKCYGIAKQ
ncbi:neurexin-4-like isoform X2 [Oculina patagonica]